MAKSDFLHLCTQKRGRQWGSCRFNRSERDQRSRQELSGAVRSRTALVELGLGSASDSC